MGGQGKNPRSLRTWLVLLCIGVVAIFFIVIGLKQCVGCGKDAAAPKPEKVEATVVMVSPGNGTTVYGPVSEIIFRVTGTFTEGKIEIKGPDANGEQAKYSGKIAFLDQGLTWTPEIAGGLNISGQYEVKVSGKNVKKETFSFTIPKEAVKPLVPPQVTPEPGTPPASDRRKTLDELEQKYPVSQ